MKSQVQVTASDLKNVTVSTQTSSQDYKPSVCEQSTTSQKPRESSPLPPPVFLK